MKKSFFLLVAGVLFSFASKASYLEACTFEVLVKAKTKVGLNQGSVSSKPAALVVEVKKVIKDNGSHQKKACFRHLDDDIKVIQLKKTDPHNINVGQRLVAGYHYVNNWSPNGIVESTSWKLSPVKK